MFDSGESGLGCVSVFFHVLSNFFIAIIEMERFTRNVIERKFLGIV